MASYFDVLAVTETGATPFLTDIWQPSFIRSNALIVLIWRNANGLFCIEPLDFPVSRHVRRTPRLLRLRPDHGATPVLTDISQPHSFDSAE